jgi:hypothetical protein
MEKDMRTLHKSIIVLLLMAMVVPSKAQIQIQPSELGFSLIVTDSVKAKQFFGNCLNLPFVGYGNIQAAKMLLYKSGNSTIKVKIYNQNPPTRDTDILAQNGIRFITIPVSNFINALTNLQNYSFTITDTTTQNGVQTAMVKDGDGNVYELINTATAPNRKLEIGIVVDSIAPVLPFYQQYLGLPVTAAVNGPTPISNTVEYRFSANQTVLRVFAPTGSRTTYNEGIADACGFRYITFTLVANTDSVYQNLISQNISVLKPLAARPSNPNIYVCMFHGPGGATHEFLGPVSSAHGATLFEKVFYQDGNIGQATVLFDMNGDSLLDFATANKSNYYLVQNNGNGNFSTLGTYPADQVNGFGSFDFNKDGKMDMTLAQRAITLSPDNLINNGNGTFSPNNLGNESIGAVRNVVYGDLNNDGYPESYHSASAFGNSYEANQLHQGISNGQFGSDIIDIALPGIFYDSVMHPTIGWQYRSALQSKGAIMRDFDRDGLTDIANAVYIDLGFQPDSFAQTYVLNQKRGLFLFQNTSNGNQITMQDVSISALGSEAVGNDSTFWNTYAPIPIDYDRDGDYDLMVGGVLLPYHQQASPDIIRLYENVSTPGNIQFVEKTVNAGLEPLNNLNWNVKRQTNLGAGAPIDYDNDGWVDILFINRRNIPQTWAPHALLFRNNGDHTFSIVPFSMHGIGGQGGGRDINYADLNRDGRLDVIISDGSGGGYIGTDSTIVYLNDLSNTNNWVQLDIKETTGGSWAYGRTVKVFAHGTNTLLGMDDIRTDFCYRSKRHPLLHFGLGTTDSVDIKIISADTTIFINGLPSNQVHYLTLDNLTTGIASAAKSELIKVYPNPTQNQLNISNLPTDFSGTVSIYNSMSQLMFSERKNDSQFSIQTGQLKTGIYIIQVKTNNGEMITRKFIKE